MGKLRLPFFVLALVALLAVVLVELSVVQPAAVAARLPGFLLGNGPSSFDQALQVFSPEQQQKLNELRSQKAGEISQISQDLSGFGVRSLAFVDGILFFSLLLMGLSIVLIKGLPLVVPKRVLDKVPPESIHAKAQGCLSFIFPLLLIPVALIFVFIVIAKLITMVMMLLSFPFGTLLYLIIFGSFPRGAMNAVLALLFVLKIVLGILLLLAHQKFIENLGLVIGFIAALVGNLIVTILYTIVPAFLVSITDAIAAIVMIIIGIILAIIMLIFSVISIISAWRPG